MSAEIKPEVKKISFEEIKKHSDRSSNWIVINNDVFDVTEFLDKHPGGEEVLIEQAGQEATEAFEDVGHSSDARAMMEQYKIGTLVDSERKPDLPKKSDPEWKESSGSSDVSWKSWIVPIAFGFVATVIYRLYFMS
ncbi:cytochrome b5 isoform X1 [Anthonomus grandis grandis]|uniref:cytochrome b5 isoform X1 n=1 Tax=Anthonomus grandis grandis TaxID=2921223 RepID=UPI002165CB86|nr:cytochrome b5 isoform X1 [Anthonomus grandis grandis]